MDPPAGAVDLPAVFRNCWRPTLQRERRERGQSRDSHSRRMNWQLLFMVGFVIITLLKLEPMARNSVPTPTHNNMLASHHYDNDTTPRITQSTAALESEVLSSKTPNNIMATVEILPCDVKLQQLSHRRCSSYDNVTNTSTHLFIYNPSNRDKFLCNAKLIIRPKSVKPLTHDDVHNKCGGRIDLMHEIAFRSHSFPQPPTMENRHQFPGILIENREKGEVSTTQLIASLQSQQLSTTKNASKNLLSVRLDDTFSSNVSS